MKGWTAPVKHSALAVCIQLVVFFHFGDAQNATTFPPRTITTMLVNNAGPPVTTFPPHLNAVPSVLPSNTPPQPTTFPPPPVTSFNPQVFQPTLPHSTAMPTTLPPSTVMPTALPPGTAMPTTLPPTPPPATTISTPTLIQPQPVTNVRTATVVATANVITNGPSTSPRGSTPGPPGLSTAGPPTSAKTELTTTTVTTTLSSTTTQSKNTGEPPEHVQLVSDKDFDFAIGTTNLLMYCVDIRMKIGTKCGVPSSRITDVSVQPQPGTDILVIRFTIQPAEQNCTAQCATASSIVQSLRSAAINTSAGLTVNDVNGNQLLVAGSSSFYAWTDLGPCSEQKCQNGGLCDCSTTGIFSCICPSTLYTGALCQTVSNRQQLAWLALLILLIPLAVGIFFIVRLVRQKDTKVSMETLESENSSTVSSYIEKPPIVDAVTAEPNTENTIAKTLSTSIALAFTDKTFIKEEAENGVGVVTVDNTVPMY